MLETEGWPRRTPAAHLLLGTEIEEHGALSILRLLHWKHRRQKGEVGRRVADRGMAVAEGRQAGRALIAPTCCRGWSYVNPEVELLAGHFAFDLGVVHCHHLGRWARRQGVGLPNSGRRGSLLAVSRVGASSLPYR